MTRSKSAGQSVSKRNARPSRDSQQNSTVIASAAKQSRGHTRPLDCFVARAPRNDGQWWSASGLREPVRHKAEFTTKLRLIVINPCLKRSSMHSCKKEVLIHVNVKFRRPQRMILRRFGDDPLLAGCEIGKSWVRHGEPWRIRRMAATGRPRWGFTFTVTIQTKP